MYSRSELITLLIREFDCEPVLATPAVDKYIEHLGEDKEGKFSSVILDETPLGEVYIEGDLEIDAEYVYGQQVYWEQPEPGPEIYQGGSGIEDIELPEHPYEDKLLVEDGEL